MLSMRQFAQRMRQLLSRQAGADGADGQERRSWQRRRCRRLRACLASPDRREPQPSALPADQLQTMTVLIRRDGIHLGSGCLRDLCAAGLGVVLIEPLPLSGGSDAELVLLTGLGGEEEIALAAELRWLGRADSQLLAGFRIHPGSLPADSELARMLQQVADPSAGAA